MCLEILFYAFNALLIVCVVYFVVKKVKQNRYNRLLKEYKIKRRLPVIKVKDRNVWGRRLSYVLSFFVIFNIAGVSYLFITLSWDAMMSSDKTSISSLVQSEETDEEEISSFISGAIKEK